MSKPLPYSAMPHLIIIRVMMDRKTLHIMYAISFCYDDFRRLIYIKSLIFTNWFVYFDCNNLSNTFLSINVVIDDVVSNGLFSVLLYSA